MKGERSKTVYIAGALKSGIEGKKQGESKKLEIRYVKEVPGKIAWGNKRQKKENEHPPVAVEVRQEGRHKGKYDI